MNQNPLFEQFIQELKRYIENLQKDYDKKMQTYENCKFLRDNYDFSIPVHEGIERLGTKKVYELLNFFEETEGITLEDMEAALHMCSAGERNPKFKNQPRYKTSLNMLNSIKIKLRAHLFRKMENNKDGLVYFESCIKKYQDLLKFITGESLNIDLQPLDSYIFSAANFSEKNWIDIYLQLLKMHMDSLIKLEEKTREIKKEKIVDVIENMALAVEEKMLESLSPESAEVIKENDDEPIVGKEEIIQIHTPIESEMAEVQEEKLVSITDERVLSLYNMLREKARSYKRFGKIDEYRMNLFSSLRAGIGAVNTLEETKLAFIPSDYLKFLYFCFVSSLKGVTESLQDQYNEEDLEDYIEILISMLESAKGYLDVLEAEISLQEQVVNQDEILEPDMGEEPVYKLVFYERHGKVELDRNMKEFSPEKLADLASLIKKIEEGNLDNARTLSRDIAIPLKGLVGRYIFVTFRVLSDNHIMIFMAANLAELNKTANRLGIYDIDVEAEVNSIIRDGDNSVAYRQLMKHSSEIRKNILAQGLVKGV